MANGLSFHIGMNAVDPAHYGPGMDLKGAVPDAKAMQAVASRRGFETAVVLDSDATCGNVAEGLLSAADRLQDGDIFLLTYAGHGSQVFDKTGDETDGYDETWCLFDRMLLDDELFSLLSNFRAGVRVLVVSDSCHSGTMTRFAAAKALIPNPPAPPVFRGLIKEEAEKIAERFSSTYKSAKLFSRRGEATPPSAAIELLAACQDNQLAQDMGTNGFFTIELLKLWSQGNYDGTYPNFFRELRDRMPAYQSPNRVSLGPDHPKFQTGRPFEI
jgi:metacaspase-1